MKLEQKWSKAAEEHSLTRLFYSALRVRKELTEIFFFALHYNAQKRWWEGNFTQHK